MNAIQMSVFAGVSSQSERTASEIVVNGFASANCRRPSGIVSAGTNTDEANVSGKISVNPIEFAVSGASDELVPGRIPANLFGDQIADGDGFGKLVDVLEPGDPGDLEDLAGTRSTEDGQ